MLAGLLVITIARSKPFLWGLAPPLTLLLAATFMEAAKRDWTAGSNIPYLGLVITWLVISSVGINIRILMHARAERLLRETVQLAPKLLDGAWPPPPTVGGE